MNRVPKWIEEEKRKARSSTTYWAEGYKIKITEALLRYMERNNIKGSRIEDELSFNWQAFLQFDEFNLENLAEVSMQLGIDWEFDVVESLDPGGIENER